MDTSIESAKILIIEADGGELARLTAAVHAAGYEVYAYQSAEEAIGKVAELLPDLILVGACKPPGDGRMLGSRVELLETLRPWALPMVVLTDPAGRNRGVLRIDPDDLPTLYTAGAADCLSRSASVAELYGRLQVHVRCGRLALQMENDA